ncbi:hypothetical protein, partial [Mesorhizobium ventifaucium]|uniref:hypothetical protein n=1 Tax=Mesorhizobium ventifaucium TaxID=666020 RepID=UPI0020A83636
PISREGHSNFSKLRMTPAWLKSVGGIQVAVFAACCVAFSATSNHSPRLASPAHWRNCLLALGE